MRRLGSSLFFAAVALNTLVVHGDEEGPVTDLLTSHPSIDDRIDRLRRRTRDGARRRGQDSLRGRRR